MGEPRFVHITIYYVPSELVKAFMEKVVKDNYLRWNQSGYKGFNTESGPRTETKRKNVARALIKTRTQRVFA